MKHKKVVFATLLAEGKLYQHCAEIEKHASEMFDILVEKMKDEHQILWVQKLKNIQYRVTESVKSELIYM